MCSATTANARNCSTALRTREEKLLWSRDCPLIHAAHNPRALCQSRQRLNRRELGPEAPCLDESGLRVRGQLDLPDFCTSPIESVHIGWVSVDATGQGGTLITKPLLFKGRRLFINADAPQADGSVSVEILDAQGRAIPGYTIAEAMPFVGDALRPRSPSWITPLQIRMLRQAG